MDYFAGLDVSVRETSVCIADDAGRREARARERHRHWSSWIAWKRI